MTILITGAAGFIGSALARELIWQGQNVIGIDNFNEYYPRRCKEFNVDLCYLSSNQNTIETKDKEIYKVLEKLREYSQISNANIKGKFNFYQMDINDNSKLEELFKKHQITKIIHLAAWAGVPLSTKKPRIYAKVNVGGTTNLLKLSTEYRVQKFLFASSSSVYGHRSNEQVKETENITKAESVYGATKVAGEVLCHAFYKSHGLKSAIVRIFGPIYGPLQRPYGMLHQRAINYTHNNKTLQIYGRNGLATAKDATYIDDEVQGILKILDSNFDYEIYNIGTANPLTIRHWLDCIEQAFNKKLQIEIIDADTADVTSSADITKAKEQIGYNPKISMLEGIKRQVEVFKLMPKWYQDMEQV
tara:strand:+ start:8969 stop:10048 length:1080 start_codon:yes stop_codon:yes gene_type:complete